MLSQGDDTNDMPITEHVKAYLKEKYNKPGKVFLGLPHRLDRPVSGVLVLTRTSKALDRITEMFKQRQMQKIYWAFVNNPPPEKEGTLTHYLVRNRQKKVTYAYHYERNDGKKSVLAYRLLFSAEKYHLLEIYPYTGRIHQIRVQLAQIGCHIKGDVKYGFNRTNPNLNIHLHAREIRFMHPVRHEMLQIVADPPQNDALWDLAMRWGAENYNLPHKDLLSSEALGE
ncbi:MAG: RNA pseudouridine synthase [Bacteroidetes bacterium]|nr:RNA pseudouridine synthase [Bacteroidota bacterium]MCB9043411.1 RNA pseudouridine synthase [Chitinophagales bacterium]